MSERYVTKRVHTFCNIVSKPVQATVTLSILQRGNDADTKFLKRKCDGNTSTCPDDYSCPLKAPYCTKK